jgi:hypothetical protein
MRPILFENSSNIKKFYGTISNKSPSKSPLDVSNSLNSHDNMESDERSFTDEDHTPWEQSGRAHHRPQGKAAKD